MSPAQRQIFNVFPYVIVSALYATVSGWVTFHATAIDYAAYLIGSHGFITGHDVYQWNAEEFQAAARILNIPSFAYPYRYTPVIAILISPLLALPYRAGLLIWSLINSAATIGTSELLGRLSENPVKRRVIRFSVWFFVPSFVSLYAGQVNPLTALLGAAAAVAISKGRDRIAGAWAALAFLVKPIAIGIICYPIWKGRWKMIIPFAAIVAITLALMIALFGWGSLHSGVPLAVTGMQVEAYPPLQNFWGTAHRWFSVHEYGTNVTNSSRLAEGAGWLLSIGLALATLLLCLPPIRNSTWREADWGMVIIAIALAVPATWYHHYVLLAIPLAFLIAGAERAADIVLAFAAWLAINMFGAAWHFLIGRTILLDLGTYGALILWIGLAKMSRRRRASCFPMK